MTRAEKAAKILAILDDLYPEPAIPLEHEDSFQLLIAVLLSAQTTDARVNECTPALFAAAPTPAAMAELPVARILHFIRRLGLAPTKAARVSALSKQLVEEFDGAVPDDLESLERLPGVGHKTASVVVAQAFGQPAFPVDTHIHRLASRWGLSRARNVVETENDLRELFPRERWADLHLKIIYFGREHCPAQYHDLSSCPICSWAASKRRIAAEKRVDRQARQRSAGRSRGRSRER